MSRTSINEFSYNSFAILFSRTREIGIGISVNVSRKKSEGKTKKVVAHIGVGEPKAGDGAAAGEGRQAGKQAGGSRRPTAGESVMWAEGIRRFEGVRSVPGQPRGIYSTPTMPVIDVSVRRETRA